MSDPLTRLVELTVYAPIGLAAVACERLPELVEEGRTRVEQRLTVARFIGQMVVTQGRREVERRIREASEPPAGPRLRVVPDVDSSSPEDGPGPDPDAASETEPVGDPDPSTSSDAVVRPGPEAVPDPEAVVRPRPEAVPDPEALPIEAYESLAAAQVVARLADLDRVGLDLVERFERTHRNRRTVLNRVAQLRSSS